MQTSMPIEMKKCDLYAQLMNAN